MEPTRGTTVGHGQESLRTNYRKRSLHEKESWWWNEDVRKAVEENIPKFKKYQESICDEDKEVFRQTNKRAKREVAKAKESVYKDLYDKLDSME